MNAVKTTSHTKEVMPEASASFVNTERVREISERALTYLKVGYPIHFSGPAGTGKTTLAFHVAAQLGRPVMLIHGDDEFTGSDLIGRDVGYRRSKLIDNYIHSVVKMEEEMRSLWAENCLTTACREGATLIYDEFTRSRPEANNALLAILEERILSLPSHQPGGRGHQQVHPQFRVIFTSNPQEYVGTHKTQDALMDRMITIQMNHHDRETEVQITMSKSGVSRITAETLVDIVRNLRGLTENGHQPTLRASVAIARILKATEAQAKMTDMFFRTVCHDVLKPEFLSFTSSEDKQELLNKVINQVCEQYAGRFEDESVESLRSVTLGETIANFAIA